MAQWRFSKPDASQAPAAAGAEPAISSRPDLAPPADTASVAGLGSSGGPQDSTPATASLPGGASRVPVDDATSSLRDDATSSLAGDGKGAGEKTPHSKPNQPTAGIPRGLRQWALYETQELLGMGGMGAVYKAVDRRLNRTVALKIIHPGLGYTDPASSNALVRRFQREARLQAALDHPHICKVFEIGDLPAGEGDVVYPYIAMQLIDGLPLHRAATEMTRMEKVRVLQQVSEAMQVAHRQDLIHRDIKPSNIMVSRTSDGRLHPYVMDFGLARDISKSDTTRSGVIEGTPRYMAPEQARGDTKNLDRRTDIYALGVTLYELLTGKSPYDGFPDGEILLAVLLHEPKPLRAIDPSIPADLEAITLKCLEKEPGRRYETAKALAEDLGRYLDGEPVRARHISRAQRLYRRAQKHKTLVGVASVLSLCLLALLSYGVRMRILHLDRIRQAQQQAELAKVLGQEITSMEWLLRSARQLSLHDLGREKALVRQRMAKLQAELERVGELGRGLSFYALGRGHMALHEYPQALTHLQSALQSGNQRAEVFYALGFVQGKLFERAMQEIRMAGGGAWAKKQRQEIEPKYLQPTLAALEKSRALGYDDAGHLSALISFYKRDYATSLQQADAALKNTPWMYELHQLAGKLHLEQALIARDGGKYEVAAQEFDATVRRLEQAAAEGRSDAEVYEDLAEVRIRQIEMAVMQGQLTDGPYDRAVEAADRLLIAEPDSFVGHLKKAFAASLAMVTVGAGKTTPALVERCLADSRAALRIRPEDPYASEAYALCNGLASEEAQRNGKEHEPFLLEWINALEKSIQKNKNFLWGINDLSNGYYILGGYYAERGSERAKSNIEMAIKYIEMAIELDPSFINGHINIMGECEVLISYASSPLEADRIISKVAQAFARCIEINDKHAFCYQNYADFLVKAALRTVRTGGSAKPLLALAWKYLGTSRSIAGTTLDSEQYTTLAQLVEALQSVQDGQDPAHWVLQGRQTRERCLKLSERDAMCLALGPQLEWAEADWLHRQGQLTEEQGRLQAGLRQAEALAAVHEKSPTSWQLVAEAQLRIARRQSGARQSATLTAAHAALAKLFAQNSEHGLGRATEGALYLLQAESAGTKDAQRHAAPHAVSALSLGLTLDPTLQHRYGPLLTQARALLSGPAGMPQATKAR